jgi:hypothetical protein
VEALNEYSAFTYQPGYTVDGDVVVMPLTMESAKYQRIRLAAILGVAPFCPSRLFMKPFVIHSLGMG